MSMQYIVQCVHSSLFYACTLFTAHCTLYSVQHIIVVHVQSSLNTPAVTVWPFMYTLQKSVQNSVKYIVQNSVRYSQQNGFQ